MAMPGGKPENLLRPLRDQTAEQRRLAASNAGKASGVARKRKGYIADAIHACLQCKIDDKEMIDKLNDLGMDLTYADAISVKMATKAAAGDVEAARFIRDTHGEKPTEKHEVRADVTDLSTVSTEELLAMVADEVADD